MTKSNLLICLIICSNFYTILPMEGPYPRDLRIFCDQTLEDQDKKAQESLVFHLLNFSNHTTVKQAADCLRLGTLAALHIYAAMPDDEKSDY